MTVGDLGREREMTGKKQTKILVFREAWACLHLCNHCSSQANKALLYKN